MFPEMKIRTLGKTKLTVSLRPYIKCIICYYDNALDNEINHMPT